MKEIYLASCNPSYEQDLNNLHLTSQVHGARFICAKPISVQSSPIQSSSPSPTFRCGNMKRCPLVVIAAIWTLPCHQLFHLQGQQVQMTQHFQREITTTTKTYHSASPGGFCLRCHWGGFHCMLHGANQKCISINMFHTKFNSCHLLLFF